jgi:signal transduction histidine kinase
VTTSASILKSSTFRLAAIYLAVFALSVGAILAYVFWNTAHLLERQAEETIRAEVLALADQYGQRGLPGVAESINRRVSEETGTLYLLVDANNAFVVGNLRNMPNPKPEDETFVDFPITIGKGQKKLFHTARAYHVELTNGFRLLVGRDVEEIHTFRKLITNTLIWALGLSLIVGLGGGYLTSRNFLRRVDAITAASRTIMAGDLSQRMPVAGTSDELDRLAQSLNDMLGQIERLMTGMKEVSSNVAHDLKTPLTRMRARAEAALRSGTEAEQRAALTQTLEESERLLDTFNALLSIARAEAGNAREGLVKADVSEILGEVAELYEPLVEEAGGTLSCDAKVPLLVRADRQLLAQSFSNLIDNAMKYGTNGSDEKVDIVMSGTREGGNAIIRISDQGQGIAAADRERVLERFVRLDDSRSKPGNGLGLSLVASVVKLHGGQFRLDDAGPGLMAAIELPLLEEAS